MAFTETEKQSLLAQKGIGPTILKRLAEMGLDDVNQLANSTPDFILQLGSEITGSTCWRNSPQARKAIETAINWAKAQNS
ncbi:recombinase RecA [Pasteurella canis]|uniref:Rad51 domain protein n=1 Tax=Pasteurella canis TaxID=753 RepID=A0ABQ4VEN4_9PAST|nr:recombinase RecA [Pasteurella canis]UAX42192.1 recombinase RecA [Pasteurella canis]UAY77746.1 recombinase RecA [Pasteurella canis]UEC23278.1 recombinase RecA [Pasteurella canis]GJH42245.1 Rad51 domain protein [Pasteurella canis]GJJ80438.1 Rad51 domain protein [Pasteurella canis]